jgi:hypothetical protein
VNNVQRQKSWLIGRQHDEAKVAVVGAKKFDSQTIIELLSAVIHGLVADAAYLGRSS